MRNCVVVRRSRGRASRSGSTRFGQAWPVASMGMPKLQVKVADGLAQKVAKVAESRWPGHGPRGINRLARDAIRRYGRYCHDRPGSGTQR